MLPALAYSAQRIVHLEAKRPSYSSRTSLEPDIRSGSLRDPLTLSPSPFLYGRLAASAESCASVSWR